MCAGRCTHCSTALLQHGTLRPAPQRPSPRRTVRQKRKAHLCRSSCAGRQVVGWVGKRTGGQAGDRARPATASALGRTPPQPSQAAPHSLVHYTLPPHVRVQVAAYLRQHPARGPLSACSILQCDARRTHYPHCPPARTGRCRPPPPAPAAPCAAAPPRWHPCPTGLREVARQQQWSVGVRVQTARARRHAPQPDAAAAAAAAAASQPMDTPGRRSASGTRRMAGHQQQQQQQQQQASHR